MIIVNKIDGNWYSLHDRRFLLALRISSSQGPFSMGMRLASSQLGSNTIATTSCKAIFPTSWIPEKLYQGENKNS